MTPDEFDQKRRELIAMRVQYKDRPEVTNRINNLIGQLQAIQGERNLSRIGVLRAAVDRSLAELSQLTNPQ